jgi:hypothetical protein
VTLAAIVRSDAHLQFHVAAWKKNNSDVGFSRKKKKTNGA